MLQREKQMLSFIYYNISNDKQPFKYLETYVRHYIRPYYCAKCSTLYRFAGLEKYC